MVSCIIASVLKDFADIKVSHALKACLLKKTPPPLSSPLSPTPPSTTTHTFQAILQCSQHLQPWGTMRSYNQTKPPCAETVIFHPWKVLLSIFYFSVLLDFCFLLWLSNTWGALKWPWNITCTAQSRVGRRLLGMWPVLLILSTSGILEMTLIWYFYIANIGHVDINILTHGRPCE